LVRAVADIAGGEGVGRADGGHAGNIKRLGEIALAFEASASSFFGIMLVSGGMRRKTSKGRE